MQTFEKTIDQRSMIVCLHDVSPQNKVALHTILDTLAPVIGKTFAAAVIPCHNGSAWPADSELAWVLRERCAELLVHGLTHQRPAGGSARSWLVQGADEFAGMPRVQAVARLEKALASWPQIFGADAETPRGFVAPTWSPGAIDAVLLQRLGLSYQMRMLSLESFHRGNMVRLPLAT